MKQGTIKTLGVAALGAAFAAAGAGTASATADQAVESTAGDVVRTLPVQETVDTLPAGTSQSVDAGQKALKGGTSTLPATTERTMPAATGKNGPTQALLGGLPVGGESARTLPADADSPRTLPNLGGGLRTDGLLGGLMPGGLLGR